MSTENTPVDSTEDDLDAFSAEFFGQSKANPEPASSDEDEEATEDTDAPSDNDEDTHPEEDTLDDEDDDSGEPEEKPEPKKKNRFQERIDELTGKQREAERKLTEALAQIEKLKQTEKTEPTPVKVVDTAGPNPDDKLDDGSEKYPLGEFDPTFIRDLTKFTIAEERKAADQRAELAAQEKEMEKQKAELQSAWNEKLVPARERYPDFNDKGSQLYDTFAGIDEKYGEYLTATIMSMEHGPDVLYYLSNNLDEAQKIVGSGATRATLALGRLEAKFAFAEEEKQRARPKVSKAPNPPVHMNKGSAPVKPTVPADTDDLDAFAKEFFKKRR